MMSSPNTSTHNNTFVESTSDGKTNEPYNIDYETAIDGLENQTDDCDETIVERVVEIG